MHRLIHTGTEVVTGSEIAHAIVIYSEALAQNRTAAAVTIPIRVGEGGEVSSAELLIGPASQLIIEPVDGGGLGELEDPELVEQIRLATHRLAPHPSAEVPSEAPPSLDEYPWPSGPDAPE